MAKDEWIYLDEADDRGVRYVAIDALGGTFGTADRSRALEINCKDRCDIKWPDDTIDTVEILLKRELNEVSDMGRMTKVACDFPGFRYLVHDHEVWVELTAVRVRRSWAEARTPQPQS